MKRVLITGITGQDGAYLSEFLLNKGYEVHGSAHDLSADKLWRLDELGVREKIALRDVDMTDEASVNALVKSVQPDEIYNLASRSFVAASWNAPLPTADVNALGTLRLLQAMRELCPTAKFYQASTSEMYGSGNQQHRQDEDTPLHPKSPYAVSKLFAHWMTINYRESFGLFACCGILFNHESPLRGLDFVTRKISNGVARIHLGLSDHISLGNMDAKRDWGFAGDYVEVMWRMLQQPVAEEFVISTGKTHSVRDFLAFAFREVGIEDWTKYVKSDPKYLRPVELQELSGKNDKAKRVLGWEPRVSFEELVTMMVRRDIERLTPQT
ncbi:MAG: GDP-mannose 4,6-dehydratase [Candidatus Peribacteraceae bacterium]|nr:GDP-mannose 4,6-dehydratase [Candidatus Peribacteraceae bacterium]